MIIAKKGTQDNLNQTLDLAERNNTGHIERTMQTTPSNATEAALRGVTALVHLLALDTAREDFAAHILRR
jgi:hypothetical protein